MQMECSTNQGKFFRGFSQEQVLNWCLWLAILEAPESTFQLHFKKYFVLIPDDAIQTKTSMSLDNSKKIFFRSRISKTSVVKYLISTLGVFHHGKLYKPRRRRVQIPRKKFSDSHSWSVTSKSPWIIFSFEPGPYFEVILRDVA